MDIAKIKADLGAALAAYREIANTAPAPQVLEASRKARALQEALSAAISEGANPCPDCGAQPHGMEQPTGKSGVEYEIGCLACGQFEHTDGTLRWHRVRGGMLPKHAVEAWNAGPDFWMKVPE